MKRVSKKGSLIISLFIISTFSMPLMVFAQSDATARTEEALIKQGAQGMYQGFAGGFGAIFNDNNMGAGGDMLGILFQMLLMQTLDLDDHEVLDGTYVMHVSDEQVRTGRKNFEDEREEYHILPYVDEWNQSKGTWGYDGKLDYNVSNTAMEGYAYCLVEKKGYVDYTLTTGVSITLTIWDHDKSFVDAFNRVIAFGEKAKVLGEGGMTEAEATELAEAAMELVLWLLIHINDIFTGDELFVLAPFSYQSLSAEQSDDFLVNKTWKMTGADWRMDGKNDKDVPAAIVNDWRGIANAKKDSRMQWLLNPYDEVDLQETIWTQFTFDILQLWIKNFHVEIDVAALTAGADNVAKVFQGCDIEFFMFSHHLTGAFLYNDVNGDKVPSVVYQKPKDKYGNIIEVKDEDGNIIEDAVVPTSSEVSHRLILGEADFTFQKPVVDKVNNKVSWGIDLDNPEVTAVPVGVDLESYESNKVETLDFIHFGLELQIPTAAELEDTDGDGKVEARAELKLQHDFGPWNDPTSPYVKNTGIGTADLAILYVSSIFHFHLKVENEVLTSDAPRPYFPDEYDNATDYDYVERNVTKYKELKVGNYITDDAKEQIDFVDIAGLSYELGTAGNTVTKTPNATVIPIGFYLGTQDSSEIHYGTEDTYDDDFTSDIAAEADYNVMMYAVSYPDFDGSGKGIWHDPTFSVYMVFTPDLGIMVALILLVGGVGLVGLATILITRKKNRMI